MTAKQKNGNLLPHSERRNYDDFNEFFGRKNVLTCPFGKICSRVFVITTKHSFEWRTWLRPVHVFSRIIGFYTIALQPLICTAFREHGVGPTEYLLIAPTHALLCASNFFISGLLDGRRLFSFFLSFNTCYRSSFAHCKLLVGIFTTFTRHHATSALLSAARSVFHLFQATTRCPMFLRMCPHLFDFAFGVCVVLGYCNRMQVVRLLFHVQVTGGTSMDVVHDYALNKNKLEYFFLVCNWVVPVVVYYYSIMIWFQFFCSLVGISWLSSQIETQGVNSLKDRFLAANMFRKKAIATVEEDANAEINCASKMRNVDCDSDDAESKVVSRRSVSGRLPVQQPHLKSQIPLRVLRRRDNFGFFASFWNELIDSLWQNDLLGYDEKNALSFISLPYAHFDVMSNPAAENVASWHVRKVEANPGMNVREWLMLPPFVQANVLGKGKRLSLANVCTEHQT